MTEFTPSNLNKYRSYTYRLFLEKLYRIVKQHRKSNTVNVDEIEETVKHLRRLQEALEQPDSNESGSEYAKRQLDTLKADLEAVEQGEKVMKETAVVVDGLGEVYVRYYE